MELHLEFPVSNNIRSKYSALTKPELVAYEELCSTDSGDMFYIMYNQTEPHNLKSYVTVLAVLAGAIADQVGAADPLQIAHNLLCNRPNLILAFYIRMVDEHDLTRLQKYSVRA